MNFLTLGSSNWRSGTKSDSLDGIGFHVCRFNQHDSRDQSIQLNSTQLSSSFSIYFIRLFSHSILTIVIVIIDVGIQIENFPAFLFLFFFCVERSFNWLPSFKREKWGKKKMKYGHCMFTDRNFIGTFDMYTHINFIFVARSIKIYHLNFNSICTHKICTLLLLFFFSFSFSSVFFHGHNEMSPS